MSRDVRTAPSVDLSMLLNQAAHAVTMRLAAALAEIGVSVKAYCVLKNAVDGDFTQAQLAERAWMDKTTMVNVLDELERSGFARRTMATADRRVRLVDVTAAGRTALARADALVQTTYEDVLGTLPAAQATQLLAALANLVDGPLSASSYLSDQLPRHRRSKS